jgi:hypothetical protein
MTVGDYILERVTSTSLFRIECVECPNGERAHVVVWSSGAAEQLEAIATEAVSKYGQPKQP